MSHAVILPRKKQSFFKPSMHTSLNTTVEYSCKLVIGILDPEPRAPSRLHLQRAIGFCTDTGEMKGWGLVILQ